MKIVILGGVAAGAKAAAKARRELPEAEINLYTDDTHISYSACGLPYYIEGNFEDYQLLLVRSPEDFEEKNVHIHLRNRAVKIIPESKQVLIQDLNTQRAFLVDYDKLIIAIGARPVIPHIKNVNLPNVFTLRKIEDGIAIREQALKSKRATIVGAGYIGMELLEALVRQNLFVTVIEYAPYVMTIFDEDMSKLIEEQLNSINNGRFEILTSEIVTELSGDADGVKSVRTGTGKEFETDFVVLCAGVTPNVEIVKDAGIELGVTGAIKVNERMETSIKDIYACGDCVEEHLVISDSKIWMPLGSNANKEGRTAAINACGGFDKFHGVLGSAVTRCLNLTMSMTGLTEKKATTLGYKPVSVTVTKNDKVGYMPNVNNITLKLIADYDTGLILGAQAVGAGDADKRINSLTAALLSKMTVDEFYKNDLTYAPPYSPTIDPLLNAAQILMGKIKKP
ncbi:TPA: pyridine nucleotide-disulfide oxidoreductase [Candidatus Gastranaerophilales bacterium HUM_20]|nr:fAD-dependent pyridine nucleotide-disulphide oxidoreductase [Clostridium sp. CAG:729]DAB18413.1 MAG TPA: pyridine nucleotide-disulfide oxidoreductase [Candidatus Gastranaerophilales bacterium HUM_20]